MKKYYCVCYKHLKQNFCTNILVHAETIETIESIYEEYEEYLIVNIKECKGYEVETARIKGMPIIEIITL